MSSKKDLSKLDLYGILGVSEDATEKEIIKSYRKQALKCHPDKNPDDPKAAEQFHQLTEALEVLSDPAAKAAYDKILKAKKAAQLRHKQYDAKRKKFKEDLEARESAVGDVKEDEASAAHRLQAEIERLRKEGNWILQQAQEDLKKELAEKEKAEKQKDAQRKLDESDTEEVSTAKIKAKWKIKKGEVRDEGYTKEDLENIFSKYGEVLNIVTSIKKSGTAIIEFSSPYTAEIAIQNVSGKEDFPLSLSWLSGQPASERLSDPPQSQPTPGEGPIHPSASIPAFTQVSFSASAPENRDYESLVLMKMRQAEERKRLIEQMMKEDAD